MNIRTVSLSLAALLVFLIGNGCEKNESKVIPPPMSSQDMVARVHWVGKRRLGVAGSAYYFMRLWDLPESKRLETQTLNKLSSAPAFLSSQSTPLNPQLASLLLRPLLNNFLEEECYFAVRQPTNQPAETVFAIKLNDLQDGIWKTNIAVLVQTLTGVAAVPSRNGWTITKGSDAGTIEMARERGWTFLGVAQRQNILLQDCIERVERYDAAFPFSLDPTTNYWLEADVDLNRIASALSLKFSFPTNSPRLSVAITGDGGNVLTHGDLIFPTRLRAEVQSWDIPTNFIREPVTSFTAVRGIEPDVAGSKLWADFSTFCGASNSPPAQACFWSQAGNPFQSFFAAPESDASARVNRLTEQLIKKGNPWLDAHGYVSFNRIPGGDGFTWGNLSMVKPFLTSRDMGGRSFVFGGLLATDWTAQTNSPARPELLQNLSADTNLAYFDWEATGLRVEPWLYITQMTRSILHRPQLAMDSAGVAWLGAIKPRLGETTTEIALAGPNRLTFTRKSTIGLTAPELHLLVDWLESPRFPIGLYSSSSASP